MKFFEHFLSHTVLQTSIFFFALGLKHHILYLVQEQQICMKKDRFALSVLKECRPVSHVLPSAFLTLSQLPLVIDRPVFLAFVVEYATKLWNFIAEKLAKLLTSKLACVSASISSVCLKSLIKIFRLAEWKMKFFWS